jgi:two-component system phosphate regulon response regulator OmpR
MEHNSEKSLGKLAAPLPDDAPHLLVVDDDNRIRGLLSKYLSENGYRVTVAASAAEARRMLASLAFDLLVIDVMMPGESGTELTRSLRQHLDVPVLILTALSGADNRIEGLEVGADDYLSKPFEPRELLLRIVSILKRTGQPAIGMPTQIRFGPYTFHLDKMELRKAKKAIRLTDRERQLLKMFADNPGDTIARHLLVGTDANLGERTADVQINRLRRKIESDPTNPTYIQTVRGVGYRLITD